MLVVTLVMMQLGHKLQQKEKQNFLENIYTFFKHIIHLLWTRGRTALQKQPETYIPSQSPETRGSKYYTAVLNPQKVDQRRKERKRKETLVGVHFVKGGIYTFLHFLSNIHSPVINYTLLVFCLYSQHTFSSVLEHFTEIVVCVDMIASHSRCRS